MHTPFVRTIVGSLAAASAFTLALVALPALADDASGDPGVARLSALGGNVDIKHGDGGDVIAGAVNAPLGPGDYVTTRDDARAEIDYGYGSAIRIAPDTQLRFTRLDQNDHALQLAEGTVGMRVFRGLEAHPEIDTPAATVRPDERGSYRVTVTNDGNTEVTVRSGRADVITQSGTQTIGPDSTLLVTGSGNDVHFETIDTVALDGFDQWNQERDAAFAHVHDYGYVDEGMVGAEDLDQYGHWIDDPSYGRVWAPYNEAADWAPYHDGRWAWEPYYGWTWVGYEPWGWAPYHYGNWFYAANYGGWCWYPGAYAAYPVYRPAVVGFFSFGFGGGGGGFSIGFGNIGWVPLAPFEAYHPWWGRGGWGWGGGRTVVVNNITNITNITNINNYRNFRAPNAAVAVTNANFAGGRFEHLVAVHPNQLANANVAAVHGVLPVAPTERSVVVNPRAAAPSTLSPNARFAHFKAPVEQPRGSVVAQRDAVIAQAQKAYPQHAALISHPEAIPATENGLVSSTTRVPAANTPAERAATTNERGTPATANERATNATANERNLPSYATNERTTPANNNERTAPVTNSERTAPATNNERTAPASTNERPANDVWSRFGNNGHSTTPSTERATTPSNERATTPSNDRATTPSNERATTPSTERATTPSTERATTPSNERATTPSTERATSNASSGGVWGRFGSGGAARSEAGNSAAPRSSGTSGDGYSAPHSSGSSGGGYSAPRSSGSYGGGYSAPRSSGSSGGGYSAPRSSGSSAGEYRAPRSSGSSGGGYSAPRASGGGGGYHAAPAPHPAAAPAHQSGGGGGQASHPAHDSGNNHGR